MNLRLTEKAKENIEIMDDVVLRDKFQPGTPRWDGKPSTWCNEAAYNIVKECGFDESLITHEKGIGWTSANDMYKIIWNKILKGELQQVYTYNQANFMSNVGNIILLAAYNMTGGSGHIAVARPFSGEYDANLGVRITQAGAENGTFWSAEIFKYNYLTPVLMVRMKEKI